MKLETVHIFLLVLQENFSDECGFVEENRFLKNRCQHTEKIFSVFKCADGVTYYTRLNTDLRLTEVSRLCPGDVRGYQACGIDHQVLPEVSTEGFFLCDSLMCKVNKLSRLDSVGFEFQVSEIFEDLCPRMFDPIYLKLFQGQESELLSCNGKISNDTCSEHSRLTDRGVMDADSVMKDSLSFCNGVCNRRDCLDEAECNGYSYGIFCSSHGNTNRTTYVSPHLVCDGLPGCANDKDELLCETENFTLAKCRRSSIHPHAEPGFYNRSYPIFNFTRCAALDQDYGRWRTMAAGSKIQKKADYIPYCEDYLDQTNCTDPLQAVWSCKISGFLSTVSVRGLCTGTPSICDDESDNMCVETSSQCKVHKHLLCDNKTDCADGSDETTPICHAMTVASCHRFYRHDTALRIPISWIKDGYSDCKTREDELHPWPTCQVGSYYRYVSEEEVCQDVFLCWEDVGEYVTYRHLCDGIEKCGSESRVCKEGRASLDHQMFSRTLVARDQRIPPLRYLLYCIPGLEVSLAYPPQLPKCYSQDFSFPKQPIIGLKSFTSLSLPSRKVQCEHTFGEVYVFLSCSDGCETATCPLIPLMHDSCWGSFPDRVYTVAQNARRLTFLTTYGGTDVYRNDMFPCGNGKCVRYDQVCNLINDCGDDSDEMNCINSIKCDENDRKIPLVQKCDGEANCKDYSDECNEQCGKQIISMLALKISAWIIGSVAISLNAVMMLRNFRHTLTAWTFNNLFRLLINIGDTITAIYILTIAVVDLIYGGSYCWKQLEWLTSKSCAALGFINTFGVQISLFSMTCLSIFRALGLYGLSSNINQSKVNFTGVVMLIVVVSAIMAYIPLIDSFEDFFVNGMTYAPSISIFPGYVRKATHIKVLKAYYGKMRSTVSLPWSQINRMIDSMFTDKYSDLGRRKIHFYGNDGVCLFKYFVKSGDPQTIFVWLNLLINFTCFIGISISYIIINTAAQKSAKDVQKMVRDKTFSRRQKQSQRSITLIIMTDFICWVPFTVICMLHSLEITDATSLYPIFSIIVLPINSVINPILYDDFIMSRAREGYQISRVRLTVSEFFTRTRSKISKKTPDYSVKCSIRQKMNLPETVEKTNDRDYPDVVSIPSEFWELDIV